MTAAIAATTLGTGVVAGPLIGAIVYGIVRVALNVITNCLIKAAAMDSYTQTVWKPACAFFEGLVTKDVLKDMSMMEATAYRSTCPQ